MSDVPAAKKKTVCELILEVASVDFHDAENLLVEQPQLLTLKDKNDRTVFHWAALLGKERLVEYLLKHEQCSIDGEDDTGATPLILAAMKGSPSICKLLIDRGAQINHENKNGHNATKYASSKNHKDVLQVLLEHGGNVNAQDHIGETPVHRVASMENVECLRLLLEHATMPVLVNLQSKQGNTPLHLACEAVDAACALLLIDHGASADILNKAEQSPLDICKPHLRKVIREKLLARDGPTATNPSA